MNSKRFGHIVVTGTPAQLAIAAQVYGSVLPGKPFPGDLEPRDFPVAFHDGPGMYALGAIIPDSRKTQRYPKGQPAYGFTFPSGLVINSDILPKFQRYALEHEPFHPIVAAHMTASKKSRLLPLVQKVIGGTRYQNRLSEVLCDAFVELFYGRSIEDDYYGDIPDADLQKAWDILMETTSEKPAPVDPPAPLPLPDDKDAQIADLTTQLEAANAALKTCQTDRDAALAENTQLAAKIAAAKGALA